MLSVNKTVVLLSLSTLLSLCAINTYAQDTQWQKHHPRREEVNGRLKHQDQRIDKERKEGEIDKSQAHQLHQQDKQIREEEKTDARHDDGHITKHEQTLLNQQENSVSHQIGQ